MDKIAVFSLKKFFFGILVKNTVKLIDECGISEIGQALAISKEI